MDHDTVANELLEEGNRRVLQRDYVNLAAERLGERCGKLEDVGPRSVHGHVYVRARARGSAGLRAEEDGYPNVLATGCCPSRYSHALRPYSGVTEGYQFLTIRGPVEKREERGESGKGVEPSGMRGERGASQKGKSS